MAGTAISRLRRLVRHWTRCLLAQIAVARGAQFRRGSGERRVGRACGPRMAGIARSAGERLVGDLRKQGARLPAVRIMTIDALEIRQGRAGVGLGEFLRTDGVASGTEFLPCFLEETRMDRRMRFVADGAPLLPLEGLMEKRRLKGLHRPFMAVRADWKTVGAESDQPGLIRSVRIMARPAGRVAQPRMEQGSHRTIDGPWMTPGAKNVLAGLENQRLKESVALVAGLAFSLPDRVVHEPLLVLLLEILVTVVALTPLTGSARAREQQKQKNSEEPSARRFHPQTSYLSDPSTEGFAGGFGGT